MVFLGVYTSEGTEGVKLWQRHNHLVGSWLAYMILHQWQF